MAFFTKTPVSRVTKAAKAVRDARLTKKYTPLPLNSLRRQFNIKQKPRNSQVSLFNRLKFSSEELLTRTRLSTATSPRHATLKGPSMPREPRMSSKRLASPAWRICEAGTETEATDPPLRPECARVPCLQDAARAQSAPQAQGPSSTSPTSLGTA